MSVTTAAGRVDIDIHHHCCGEKAAEETKKAADGKSDSLGGGILKALGAAAAGLGTVGAIVAVGATVLWIRFNEAGIPAMQAVSVQPKYEALVQGGQQTAVVLMIALVAVLLIYFTDPGGIIRRITLVAFALLFGVAVWCTVETHLSPVDKAGLVALAAVLAVGAIVVGLRTEKRFWPLGLAVFIAALVFSSVSALLITRDQDFVQAVAVLRGAQDAGLTGFYVAAGEKTLYIARPTPIPADESSKMAMMDISRAGASYAVGPLESREKAEQRARVMLAGLVEARERNPAADSEGTTKGETAEEDASSGGGEEEASTDAGGGGEEGSSKPATPQEPGLEQVLRAFRSPVRTETKAAAATCLVRYGDASSPTASGHWWTSCGEAEKLKTIVEVRERLALPVGRFQSSYDAKIEATLPAGVPAFVVEGKAAAQCEHETGTCGRRYSGGGVQFWVAQPQQLAIHGRLCTTAPEGAPSRWRSCPG